MHHRHLVVGAPTQLVDCLPGLVEHVPPQGLVLTRERQLAYAVKWTTRRASTSHPPAALDPGMTWRLLSGATLPLKVSKSLPAFVAQLSPNLPPPGSGLSIALPLEAPLRDLPPEHLDIIQLVLNNGTMQAVLDKCPMSDLDASQAVATLLQKNYLHPA